jgi:hypothetical protein
MQTAERLLALHTSETTRSGLRHRLLQTVLKRACSRRSILLPSTSKAPHCPRCVRCEPAASPHQRDPQAGIEQWSAGEFQQRMIAKGLAQCRRPPSCAVQKSGMSGRNLRGALLRTCSFLDRYDQLNRIRSRKHSAPRALQVRRSATTVVYSFSLTLTQMVRALIVLDASFRGEHPNSEQSQCRLA